MSHAPEKNKRVKANEQQPPAWAKKLAKPRTRARAMEAPPTGGSYVTILAHSDDELLFINPDLHAPIKAGLPSRTIYLTADEANGWPGGGFNREQYAARLHGGTREAYASMAGVPSNWTIDAITVAGKQVERNTLQGAPHVQLYWLNLPDGGDDLHSDTLEKMWKDQNFRTITIIPTGSPVTQVQEYGFQDLYAVLVELLTQFQATTIRIQDPAPDLKFLPPNPGDHTDHIHATYFAQFAVKTYMGPDSTQQCLLLRYRCYNSDESPSNVPPALYNPKNAAWLKYKQYLDPAVADWDAYISRSFQRFPVTESFVIKDGTGALHAVIVGGHNVIAWRLNAGGVTWSAPTILESGSFAPGVAMELNQDGTVQLAVYSLDEFVIKTAKQTAPGGAFGPFTSIGSPSDVIGVPTMGRNSDNCIELYALNASGGISNAWQSTPNGPIAGWVNVPGTTHVLGQPTVFSSTNGVLNVFADNNGQIAHWTQPVGGSTNPDLGFPALETVGTPCPVLQANGRGILIIREHGDGAMGFSKESTPGGSWGPLTHMNGNGGTGPSFGALSAPAGSTQPQVFAFKRNDNYGISVRKQGAGGSFNNGGWTDLGGYCEIGPAAVLDNAGIMRLLVVGGDCRLYEAKQTGAGPSAGFTAFQAVGV